MARKPRGRAATSKRKPDREQAPISNLVVVSDLHGGDAFGLFTLDRFRRDEGGYYYPSPLQQKVAEMWRIFWDEWVPMVTRGEPYAVALNGDAVDGVHHRSVTQWTHNLEDQAELTYQMMAPIVDRCEGRYFHLRGTEAHVGSSGQDEEKLAKRLGAIPNEEGNHARWELWTRVGFGLVHLSHHIGTAGSLAYETTAIHKELEQAFVEAGRWNQEMPSVICRCLSDDTELLTKAGWKGMQDVQVGDEVMTLHTLANRLEWQKTTDKVVNEHEPEMIHFSGRGTDVLVTPDHNMVVQSTGGHFPSGWTQMPAEKVMSYLAEKTYGGHHLSMPISGYYEGTPVPFSLEQLWLLGFFMADGSFVRQPNGLIYAARVHQATARKTEVEAALRAAGIVDFHITENVKEGTPHFDHRKSRWIYTRQHCSTWYIPNIYLDMFVSAVDTNKRLRPHMLEMLPEQFEALLAGFHYGDGCRKSTRIYNADEVILDQFQELFVKHGCKSTLHYGEYYTTKRHEKKRCGSIYYLPDRPSAALGQKYFRGLVRREAYGRASWCVCVPNETLVIRRNGCVSIVGNSHRHRNCETRIQTHLGFATSFTTAGWQLKTPFVYRIPGGRQTQPQIGGSLIRCGDEDLYTRHKLWTLDRPKVETLYVDAPLKPRRPVLRRES